MLCPDDAADDKSGTVGRPLPHVDHKVPTSWFACSAPPLTASGKVQKFRLREIAQAGELEPLSDSGN